MLSSLLLQRRFGARYSMRPEAPIHHAARKWRAVVVAVPVLLSTVGCHGAERARDKKPTSTAASASTRIPTQKANSSAPEITVPTDQTSGGFDSPEIVCDARLDEVASAITNLESEPPTFEIEHIHHPIAYAYTALLRSGRGDYSGSSQAIEQIPEYLRSAARDFIGDCAACETKNQVRWKLALIRETTFWWGASSCPGAGGLRARTWCGMFDQYPQEAMEAFEGGSGASQAGEAAEQKAYCVERLLTKQGAAVLGKTVSQAIGRITAAMRALEPLPIGTGYSLVTYQMEDALHGPILSPDNFVGLTVDNGALAAGISEAHIYVRDLDARLARVRSVSNGHAPILAAAICKRAEHGRARLTPRQCLELARTSTERALAIWLSARPYAARYLDAKGNIVEPTPWRR
jgi:hypothetical protein